MFKWIYSPRKRDVYKLSFAIQQSLLLVYIMTSVAVGGFVFFSRVTLQSNLTNITQSPSGALCCFVKGDGLFTMATDYADLNYIRDWQLFFIQIQSFWFLRFTSGNLSAWLLVFVAFHSIEVCGIYWNKINRHKRSDQAVLLQLIYSFEKCISYLKAMNVHLMQDQSNLCIVNR